MLWGEKERIGRGSLLPKRRRHISHHHRTKVLLIIARMNIGGPAVHVALLASSLPERGYETLLVKGCVGPGEAEMSDLVQMARTRLVEIPELGREISVWDDVVAFLKLWRLIRRERPTIVDTHTAKAGTLGRLAARLGGVPVVVHTFHGHVFTGYFGPWKSCAVVTWERLLALLADGVIAVGPRQKEALARFRICAAKKIWSVPYGLDLTPFVSNTSYRGAFKRELGLNQDHVLVGIVARLVPIKGHRIFLEAARQVSDCLSSVRFVVVGDGELRGALEAQVHRLGLEEVVYFTGYRRDLPRIYASLDLVVLASFNEGLPIVLIEALAAGCYVVATDVGGVSDLIRNAEAGILVPPGDAGALARVMIEAIQREASVSESEREHVLRRYGSERLLDDVEALYGYLLGRR